VLQGLLLGPDSWHLFLKQMKFHIPLARIVSERIATDGQGQVSSHCLLIAYL
jgi:hypothetical protein